MKSFNRRHILLGLTVTTSALLAPKTLIANTVVNHENGHEGGHDADSTWQKKQREIMVALAFCCYRRDEYAAQHRTTPLLQWQSRQRQMMLGLANYSHRNDEFVERSRTILMQMLIKQKG